MGKDKSTANQASLNRINFLYQAAHTVLLGPSPNFELVRFYVHSLKSVAKKNVLRLDPSIKRNLCKKCLMLLIPGVTATVRTKAKRRPHTVVRCTDCGSVKRFVFGDDHQLWSEHSQAWASNHGNTQNVTDQGFSHQTVSCAQEDDSRYTRAEIEHQIKDPPSAVAANMIEPQGKFREEDSRLNGMNATIKDVLEKQPSDLRSELPGCSKDLVSSNDIMRHGKCDTNISRTPDRPCGNARSIGYSQAEPDTNSEKAPTSRNNVPIIHPWSAFDSFACPVVVVGQDGSSDEKRNNGKSMCSPSGLTQIPPFGSTRYNDSFCDRGVCPNKNCLNCNPSGQTCDKDSDLQTIMSDGNSVPS